MLNFAAPPRLTTPHDFERAKVRLAYLLEKTCTWTSDEVTELTWLRDAVQAYEPTDEHETHLGAG